MKLTTEERLELAAGDSWREWGKQFGWVLYGWTGDAAATFMLSDPHELFDITRRMRRDIDELIALAGRTKDPSND